MGLSHDNTIYAQSSPYAQEKGTPVAELAGSSAEMWE
jgi:hypothetical protein